MSIFEFYIVNEFMIFQDDQFLPTVPDDANIMSLLLEAEDSLSQLDILSKIPCQFQQNLLNS